MIRQWILRPVCALLIFGAITGCASPGAEALQAESGAVPLSEGAGGYEIPAFHDAAFDPAAAETQGTVRADFSGLEKGYIALEATSDKRLKFRSSWVTQNTTTTCPVTARPRSFP